MTLCILVRFSLLPVLVTLVFFLSIFWVSHFSLVTYFILNVHFQLKHSAFASSALHFHFAFASLWSASLPCIFTSFAVTFRFSNPNLLLLFYILFSVFLLINQLLLFMVFVLLFSLFLTSSLTLIFALKSLVLILFFMFFMPMLHSLAMFVSWRVVFFILLIFHIHIADRNYQFLDFWLDIFKLCKLPGYLLDFIDGFTREQERWLN